MIFLQTKMVLFSKIAEKEKDGGGRVSAVPSLSVFNLEWGQASH